MTSIYGPRRIVGVLSILCVAGATSAASAQATGNTITIEGDYAFCLPHPNAPAPACDPSGATVDALTVGPATDLYPGGFPIGQILDDVAGDAIGFSGDATASVLSSTINPCGAGSFPPQSAFGVDPYDTAFSGTWSSPAQVSSDCGVPYDVNIRVKTDSGNVYDFARKDDVVVPQGATMPVDGGTVAEAPAIVRVCYRLADYEVDGTPIANPDNTTYFSNDLECPCGTSGPIAVSGGSNIGLIGIGASPSARKAAVVITPGDYQDVVVQGGYRYHLTSDEVIVDHPVFGSGFQMLVASGRAGGSNNVYLDLDNDHPVGVGGNTDATGISSGDLDDVIAPLGVGSVCIPLAGTNRSCALGRASLAPQPANDSHYEYGVGSYSVLLDGGQPDIDAAGSSSGTFDATGVLLSAAPAV